MRVKNSIINVFVSILAQAVTVVLGFITQKVFIDLLGTEILGINGLFSNIISMLGIAELGIGTAVIYNLYKPLAENDIEQIQILLKFYRKCYKKIAITILILGMLFVPFLHSFVGEIETPYNIYVIYILFLLETLVSYFLTYKRSILYADQKNYIINLIHIIYLAILNIGQIAILIFTKNYILYLIIKIVMRLVENVIINIVTLKIYPYIAVKNNKELESEKKKEFYKNLKGLVLHKLSWIIIGGTDNIVISKFVGIYWVGIYTNYVMITNTIEQLVAQMFSAITGSVGNLLASETKEKAFDIYKKTSLLQYIVYSTATVGIFCVSKSFIKLWLGSEEFILNQLTVFLICISFFFCGMRRNICVFKDAAGIFYDDRKLAVIASILNIVISVILVTRIGINGVIIGTIICYLFLHIFSYSKYIYQKIFGQKRGEYFKEIIKYSVLLLISIFLASYIVQITSVSNLFIKIIKDVIISIVVTNAITIIIFRNSNEYLYCKSLLIDIARKIKNKIKIKA